MEKIFNIQSFKINKKFTYIISLLRISKIKNRMQDGIMNKIRYMCSSQKQILLILMMNGLEEVIKYFQNYRVLLRQRLGSNVKVIIKNCYLGIKLQKILLDILKQKSIILS